MRSLWILLWLWSLSAPGFAIYDDPTGGSGSVQIALPDQNLSAIPGEYITLPSFRLSYRYEDVNLPGTPGLNLVFARRYFERGNNPLIGFGGDWWVDLPFIKVHTGTPATDFACLGNVSSINVKMQGGEELRTVGFASASDLPSSAVRAFATGELLVCESGDPKIILENGLKYSFGVTAIGTNIRLPTRLEDRFGNYITYSYSTVDGSTALTSAARNDGASYTVSYGDVGGGNYRVTTVTQGNRTHTYSYTASGAYTVLETHTDPVGRETDYDHWPSTDRLWRVHLPTGATLEYTQWLTPVGYWRVQQRTISGPSVATRTTTFNRNSSVSSFGQDPNNSNFLLSTVTEVDFDGTKDLKTEYRFHNYAGSTSQFNNGVMAKFGKLTSIETFVDATLVYKLENTWTHIKHGEIGCSYGIGSYGHRKNCGRANLELSKETIYNSGGSDVFETDPLSYDKYGYPLQTRLESSTGVSRYVKKEYAHNLTFWLIGLPYKTYLSPDSSTWTETERVTYYPTTEDEKHLPRYTYLFGIWQKEFEYYENGELEEIDYNSYLNYERYANYKRGVPQTITVPRRYTTGTRTTTRVVDDYGNITSENDFNGNVTTYTYDKINRVKTKNFADAAWSDVSWYYDDIGTYQYARRSSGALRTDKVIDGLGRLRREILQDTSDSSTKTYVNTERDALGRISLRTHPSTSSSSTNGIEYEYDGLNRITREVINETNTDRTWEYLNNHRVRYTDTLNNQTTTTYQAYGTPKYDFPTLISQPESVTTSISYTLFDQFDQVTQGGITEDYIYDSKQRLCKRVRPDVNKIGYGYNNIRQRIWKYHGDQGSSSSCGGESAFYRTTYTYDNRGDLREELENGSSSKAIQKRTLDANGNLTQMESRYGTWTYLFNSRDFVEQETLSVNGRTYILDWSYNALGHVQSLEYPGGQTISFSPNAIGQPSQAGTYATGAEYHETGALEAFSYGNGIHRDYQLNAMGMATEIRDFLGSSRRFEHDYFYDEELNVEDIFDRQNSLYSVNNLTYDGTHRLKTGDGQWGSTNIQYDNRNNITSMQLGSQTYTYGINASTNRLDSISGAISLQYQYDSRGNVWNNGLNTLVYNEVNQLESANNQRHFEYDGHGRRIEKRVVNGVTRNSLYGLDGKLYHQKVVGGKAMNYIYLGDALVARETAGSGGNAAPVAGDDFLEIDTYEAITFSPLIDDNDADGDVMTITSVSNSQFTIVGGGSSLYFPGTSVSDFIFLTYTISDGNGGSDTAQITVEVD